MEQRAHERQVGRVGRVGRRLTDPLTLVHEHRIARRMVDQIDFVPHCSETLTECDGDTEIHRRHSSGQMLAHGTTPLDPRVVLVVVRVVQVS